MPLSPELTPTQPTSTSGWSSASAHWSSASSPITVWCSSTWLAALPRVGGAVVAERGLDGLAHRDPDAAG
jgi:hypothetical protein